MADLSLIKIWELQKTKWWDEQSSCEIPEVLRDWLPITQYTDDGRVTVRAPYPIGDFDNFNALSNDDKECSYCSGSGKTLEGATCPICHGTGVPCDSIGAISVDDHGIIRLQIDQVSLGINAEGKLFARLKIADKGGLDLNEDSEIFVKVDDKSIKVNEDGQLYAVTTEPYSAVNTIDNYDLTEVKLFDAPNVDKVKLHISVDIKSTAYESANELTRFTLAAGGASAKYCWDKTVPYTMINFDTIIENPSDITFKLTPETGDNFNGSEITVSANVISC